ncbi:MAG: MBL fold metallo-hydrolase [Parcubacteria group bacterium]|nr:MBL fold metallo-hydrolase [Parcubacteria group bacterium]
MKNIVILVLIVLVVGGYFYNRDNGLDVTPESVEISTIPETAKGPEIPQDKGYLVEEINDGLYWLTDGTYQMMFLVTSFGVIVVDAPPSIGENILVAIAEVTDNPITHVIYSHHHADHIAAANLYPANAVYLAHNDTATMINRSQNDGREFPFGTFVGGGDVPKPNVTFNTNYVLISGGQRVNLTYLGTNHSPGNILIYAPQQKVAMIVDVIFPGWVPFMDLAVSDDVNGYLAAHDQILAFDFDTLIAGHLTRLGTKEDVELQKEYLSDIKANATTALQEVDLMAVAEETGFENQWALFGTYLDEVNQQCADLTLGKWATRLGGAPEFTKSQCARIAESLRIN